MMEANGLSLRFVIRTQPNPFEGFQGFREFSDGPCPLVVILDIKT
jgi:hypothetical protein